MILSRIRGCRSHRFALPMHPYPPYCLVAGIYSFRHSTDYILSMPYLYGLGANISVRLYLLPSRGIVVEGRAIRSFPADLRLLKCLGFNHTLSNRFFLLSSPSRLGLFHPYVVVLLALRHLTAKIIVSKTCSSIISLLS